VWAVLSVKTTKDRIQGVKEGALDLESASFAALDQR
jgi:hypothetical protein